MNTNKDWTFTFRLRKEEYFWLEASAKSEDLSNSPFLRRILLRYLRENYPNLKPAEQAGITTQNRKKILYSSSNQQQ